MPNDFTQIATPFIGLLLNWASATEQVVDDISPMMLGMALLAGATILLLLGIGLVLGGSLVIVAITGLTFGLLTALAVVAYLNDSLKAGLKTMVLLLTGLLGVLHGSTIALYHAASKARTLP